MFFWIWFHSKIYFIKRFLSNMHKIRSVFDFVLRWTQKLANMSLFFSVSYGGSLKDKDVIKLNYVKKRLV